MILFFSYIENTARILHITYLYYFIPIYSLILVNIPYFECVSQFAQNVASNG